MQLRGNANPSHEHLTQNLAITGRTEMVDFMSSYITRYWDAYAVDRIPRKCPLRASGEAVWMVNSYWSVSGDFL